MPFELRPYPQATLRPDGEYLQRAWSQSVYPLAERMGVEIRLPSVSPQPHTHLAFEGFQHAKEHGKGNEYNHRLLSAFFQEDQDIGQIDVLADLAADVGLDADELRQALETRKYRHWLLLWPELSFVVVAVGYLGLSPRVFGKRSDGTMQWYAVTLLFPYLLLTWLTWHMVRLTSREDCWNEVVPGVFVGRRPLANEVPDTVLRVGVDCDRAATEHHMDKLEELVMKTVNRADIIDLQQIPNVGPAIASDLRLIGVSLPQDLVGKDPYKMYDDLCDVTGKRHDPCVIDVFIAAVRFMGGESAKPWWKYTPERKRTLTAKAKTKT